MILDKFPSTEEFYKTYWGEKPFVVRGAIDKGVCDGLIDGNSLAGLSLEEDIRSRIMITAPEGSKWTCEHGPFDEGRFSSLGEKNWSLLVQGVEQYHTDTAILLDSFHFSPCWLMDDIMVSYSTKGGSVGPHTDSYHVFLVQGIGRRTWRVGYAPIENEEYIGDLDLKVLKDGFDGEEFDVSMGDVIYIPPHFAHEGITIEEAMTFSIGFLGPRMSEIMMEYAKYLEENEHLNKRYAGQGLDESTAGFTVCENAQRIVRSGLVQLIESDDFSEWLAEYFFAPK